MNYLYVIIEVLIMIGWVLIVLASIFLIYRSGEALVELWRNWCYREATSLYVWSTVYLLSCLLFIGPKFKTSSMAARTDLCCLFFSFLPLPWSKSPVLVESETSLTLVSAD